MYMLQEERTKALADVASATAVVKQLESELAKYKESDPEVLEQQKREAASALEAANRWTGGCEKWWFCSVTDRCSCRSAVPCCGCISRVTLKFWNNRNEKQRQLWRQLIDGQVGVKSGGFVV